MWKQIEGCGSAWKAWDTKKLAGSFAVVYFGLDGVRLTMESLSSATGFERIVANTCKDGLHVGTQEKIKVSRPSNHLSN